MCLGSNEREQRQHLPAILLVGGIGLSLAEMRYSHRLIWCSKARIGKR